MQCLLVPGTAYFFSLSKMGLFEKVEPKKKVKSKSYFGKVQFETALSNSLRLLALLLITLHWLQSNTVQIRTDC